MIISIHLLDRDLQDMAFQFPAIHRFTALDVTVSMGCRMGFICWVGLFLFAFKNDPALVLEPPISMPEF